MPIRLIKTKKKISGCVEASCVYRGRDPKPDESRRAEEQVRPTRIIKTKKKISGCVEASCVYRGRDPKPDESR
ncbi:hypothetical protein J6590_006646 [Homalodisca vitripennis]|nr:hypothetical protein J6590_006646 [Homalodisca vitripennis]